MQLPPEEMTSAINRLKRAEPAPPPEPARDELKELTRRREDLLALIQAEKNRLESARSGRVRASLHRSIEEDAAVRRQNLARSLSEHQASSVRAIDISLLFLREAWKRDPRAFDAAVQEQERMLHLARSEYADEAHEIAMLNLPHAGLSPDLIGEIHPLMGAAKLTKAQREVDRTVADEDVVRYVVQLVRSTRELKESKQALGISLIMIAITAALAGA